MFVTRATRHDKDDIAALLTEQGWDLDKLDKGTAYIARDGVVVGTVRLIEVGPQTVVVEDMLVKEGRRREGIGRRLMETAMNARGGTLYLCTHDDSIPFYKQFGFELIEGRDCPEPVQALLKECFEDSEHEHFFLKAR